MNYEDKERIAHQIIESAIAEGRTIRGAELARVLGIDKKAINKMTRRYKPVTGKEKEILKIIKKEKANNNNINAVEIAKKCNCSKQFVYMVIRENLKKNEN